MPNPWLGGGGCELGGGAFKVVDAVCGTLSDDCGCGSCGGEY